MEIWIANLLHRIPIHFDFGVDVDVVACIWTLFFSSLIQIHDSKLLIVSSSLAPSEDVAELIAALSIIGCWGRESTARKKIERKRLEKLVFFALNRPPCRASLTQDLRLVSFSHRSNQAKLLVKLNRVNICIHWHQHNDIKHIGRRREASSQHRKVGNFETIQKSWKKK